MSREWTPQQRSAIYATDGSVLVSAAAGSGKTAVLVERVIKMITREENPIDADRLLIVTFTRAAATEMRQRISLALNSLLEKDPYNPQLIKQKQLLYNSSISTIDSFCCDIVREYFHTLDISRDFRMADEGELTILSNSALDKAFEIFYNSDTIEFANLLDAFSSKGGDVKLRETVLKVYKFLSTQPFPEKWLDDMIESYAEDHIEKSIWGKIIIDYANPAILHAITLTENSISLLEEDEKLKNSFIVRIEEDLQFLNLLQKKLYSESWDSVVNHLDAFVAGRLTPPKGYKDNPVKIQIGNNRDEVKVTIKLLKSYFCKNEEQAREELKELQKVVATLFELVREYIKNFDELKKKKNILSFSDVELLTVKLLASPDGDSYIKTPQAYEISSRYDAVMVDEFQDVNDVQDLIFNCTSTNEENLFVVGDVKQSIYGFRQAKPQIFINRKNSYNRFDETKENYPATIILDKNFRSRKEVCDTVNFIFSRLMLKDSAQMDYTKDEQLNVGASYPVTDKCDFEISLIEKSDFESLSVSEIEAQYISKKIRKMMADNFTVKDGDFQRRATYGDFAIILRSTKNSANTYVNTLIDNGIPAYCEEKENSFEALEVKILLNILRAIDNPSLDIPLLSVLCSPIYGFTPDELAQIRAESRYANLYTSLNKFKDDKKVAGFLNELKSLRTYSNTCTVDELIGKVYEVTALTAITSAVKGGDTPLQNLNLIRVYARSFEANGYKTLSDFIYYIDKLIENSTSLNSAQSGDGDTLNAVRVLSIHKSKGLEFPVCFIADTAHNFNTMDLKSDVLLDSFAGIGIKRKSGICRYNTFPRQAVEIEISRNEIAEELRVLYVALTRAKEKLIAVSTVSDTEKYLSKIYSKLAFGKIIEPYAVVRCKSISDWIVLTAMVHPNFNEIRFHIDNTAPLITLKENYPEWTLNLIDSNSEIMNIDHISIDISEILSASNKTTEFNYAELLMKNLSFSYRNSNIMNLPQKVSASQIAHDANNEFFSKVLMKPNFLNTEATASVERGTAHHIFLQHCDIDSARNDLENEINRQLDFKILTETQATLIDKDKITALINSKLFDRILNSPMMLREERFTAKIKPSMIFEEYQDLETDATVIMQGAVDIVFEEDGKLVIVDYKTDRVNDISKLKVLYKKQLDLYKEAITQSMEMEVKECIICSVHLNDYITA